MEELLPVISDDVHWAEEKQRVPADHTRYLGWEGKWYRLDMTTIHTLDIETFLARFLAAGQPLSEPPPKRPPAGKNSPGHERNQKILAYAKRTGLKYTERSKGKGSPYFPVATVRAYEAAVARGEVNDGTGGDRAGQR